MPRGQPERPKVENPIYGGGISEDKKDYILGELQQFEADQEKLLKAVKLNLNELGLTDFLNWLKREVGYFQAGPLPSVIKKNFSTDTLIVRINKIIELGRLKML